MTIRHRIFEPDHIAAHEHCSINRVELERSEICGCFYCTAIFPPDEIHSWIDEGRTSECPRCEIDAVIGSASGYPITREFLERMHAYWFDSVLAADEKVDKRYGKPKTID
jgi:hypothetical protein